MSSLPPIRLPHLDPRRTGNAEEGLRNVEDWLNTVLPRALNQMLQGVQSSLDQQTPDEPEGETLPSGAANGEVLAYDANLDEWVPEEGNDRWLPLEGGELTGFILWLLGAASDKAMRGQVSGDSQDRFYVQADGKIVWGPGNAALDTNLYRSAANVLGTDDDFAILAAGKGIQVKEGSNSKMGVATLVAGAVTVANTSVTANSRIFLTVQALGGTQGMLAIANRVNGTSFDIVSSDVADTSTVAWILFEPA